MEISQVFGDLPLELIDEDTIRFISQNVSISLATCSVDNRPALSRAFGVRVSEDRLSLRIFIARDGNHEILDNIRSNKQLAVFFSRPSTNKSLQLKSTDARLEPIDNLDLECLRLYRQSLKNELAPLGFDNLFVDAMIPDLNENDVAICFTPLSAFNQTPGPDAGRKISS